MASQGSGPVKSWGAEVRHAAMEPWEARADAGAEPHREVERQQGTWGQQCVERPLTSA